MATTLFLRDNTVDPSGYGSGGTEIAANGVASSFTQRGQLATTRGSVLASSGAISTSAGPATISVTAQHSWISPPLDADVTISGAITWNIWAQESNMAANVAINGILSVYDGATGAITLIDRTARTTELAFGGVNAVNNFAETPAAGVLCKRGDRLRVEIFGSDAGTMASGYTFQMGYAGPTASVNGDTYLTLTENLTFVSEPAGTTIYPTDTASTLGGVSASLLSDFTGGSEVNLSEGGNWARLDSSAANFQRISNQGAPASGDALAGSYWTPSDFGPDVEAFVTLATLAAGDILGVVARVQNAGGAATWDGYLVYATGSTTIAIDRVTNATRTVLATATVATWASGDKIGIACHGNTIEAWKYTSGAWTRHVSTTDTTYSAAGKVGMLADSATGSRFDDFYAGTATETFPVVEREAWTSRGAGVQTDVTNTVAGPTAGIQTTDTAGGTVVDWFTKPLQAFTLGGAVRCNIRAAESNASANAAIAVEIAVVNGDGTSPVVWSRGQLNTELGNETPQSFLTSGDDLAVSDGQRLRIRLYADDVNVSMGTGYTVTTYYAGTSGGASGDTYLTFTQTLTEYSGAVAATPFNRDNRLIQQLAH